MNWKRINIYAIGCDNFTISKALVSGEPRYTLWDGDRMIKICKTPEEAKSMAEKEVESVG
jgi:hypothetical protein